MALKGHIHTSETRKKISETLKRKGIKPLQRFCAKGKEHPSWKGGITKDEHGYIMIKTENHHRADKRGYVKRSVIIAENMLKRQLNNNEIVHHINRIKSDDREENLIVVTKSDHAKLHRKNEFINQYESNGRFKK